MYEDTEIEERVDKLEFILGEFIVQTNTSLSRLSREMRDFKNEMRDFKNEMSDFKNEMSEFKNEMSDFKNEMGEFKNEMRDFKNEMSEFKNEVRNDQKQMNKKWGELANKMGTLVEDIIAPAVRPVMEKYFNCEILSFFVNVRKKDRRLGMAGEFDVIGVSDDHVFLVEAKSRPKTQYLYDFIKNMEKFRKLFPEYADKKLIPVFSSLRFEDELISLANQEKIYLLAFREWEYMDLLNFEEIRA
ncbi:MAG: hypothetical protein R2941_04550 [Desulfobacterales bacterium]